MSDKIKESEEMNENKETQKIDEEKVVSDKEVQEVSAEDLGDVAGGRNLAREFVQRFMIMSEKEEEDIRSLINEYDSLMRKSNALNVIACENPKSFNEDATIRATDVKIRKELVEVKDKLRNYYKKFSNIPELKRFR